MNGITRLPDQLELHGLLDRQRSRWSAPYDMSPPASTFSLDNDLRLRVAQIEQSLAEGVEHRDHPLL